MAWTHFIRCLLVGIAADFAVSCLTTRNSAQDVLTPIQAAFEQYTLHASNYTANLNNTTSAWKFAEACFEWAEFATNDTQRAAIAKQGIAAAKSAVALAPGNPGGHLFLGLNLGQLARTKLFSALGLVRDMERAWLDSIKADEKFDYAAAHRSLGMLYVEAPGWPASIGNRVKAHKHLERSIELAPDYPDNHLSALEAYAGWKDLPHFRPGLTRYQRILPEARRKYQGFEWKEHWRDWDARWVAIQSRAENLLGDGE